MTEMLPRMAIGLLLILSTVQLASTQSIDTSSQHIDAAYLDVRSWIDGVENEQEAEQPGAPRLVTRQTSQPSCFGGGLSQVSVVFTSPRNSYPVPEGGIKPGMTIVWSGLKTSKSHLHSGNFREMRLALWTRRDSWHDTPFTIGARWFLKGEIEKQIVMNTLTQQAWGTEQHAYNPLREDDDFTIKILVKTDAYQVFVNDKYVADYKHRMPYTAAAFVHVSNESLFNKIKFIV